MTVLDLDEEHFNQELEFFHIKRSTPIVKIPTLNHIPVNFYSVFHKVYDLGGYSYVTKNKLWREVIIELNYPLTQTTSTQLRYLYERYLYPFERVKLYLLPDSKGKNVYEILQDDSTGQIRTLTYLKSKDLVSDHLLADYESDANYYKFPPDIPTVSKNISNCESFSNIFMMNSAKELVCIVFYNITLYKCIVKLFIICFFS